MLILPTCLRVAARREWNKNPFVSKVPCEYLRLISGLQKGSWLITPTTLQPLSPCRALVGSHAVLVLAHCCSWDLSGTEDRFSCSCHFTSSAVLEAQWPLYPLACSTPSKGFKGTLGLSVTLQPSLGEQTASFWVHKSDNTWGPPPWAQEVSLACLLRDRE
jgi:hypothetical protein